LHNVKTSIRAVEIEWLGNELDVSNCFVVYTLELECRGENEAQAKAKAFTTIFVKNIALKQYKTVFRDV
jgi:hypothetical protein